jgi:hypothetical protein
MELANKRRVRVCVGVYDFLLQRVWLVADLCEEAQSPVVAACECKRMCECEYV